MPEPSLILSRAASAAASANGYRSVTKAPNRFASVVTVPVVPCIRQVRFQAPTAFLTNASMSAAGRAPAVLATSLPP